jgi:hypothetical protein
VKIRVTITNAIVNNGATLDALAFVADTDDPHRAAARAASGRRRHVRG